MSHVERRNFLKLAGTGLLAMGLGARRAWAQSANRHVQLLIFLRGGADGVSLLHPAPGSSAARGKYEAWRRAGTRITGGIPVADGLAMHPALAALGPVLDAGHLCFVPGVGGAVPNRSHFQQQDLVESGAGGEVPLADGILGRALAALDPDEVIGGVALGANVPYALRRGGGISPLALPDLRSFGKLRSSTHRPDPDSELKTRISRLYVPLGTCLPGQLVCEVGRQAAQGVEDASELLAAAAPVGELGADLASLLRVDTDARIRFLALDLGGWDTHAAQGADARAEGAFTGALARNLEKLAALLRSFHDAAQTGAVFNRVTVQVITEFGRTTFENGTGGTDHGFGGVALVMSSGLRRKVVPTGWFPASASHAFYGTAESTRALPRLMEHRQVFAEILRRKHGVTDLAPILPGFTFDTGAPQIFA